MPARPLSGPLSAENHGHFGPLLTVTPAAPTSSRPPIIGGRRGFDNHGYRGSKTSFRQPPFGRRFSVFIARPKRRFWGGSASGQNQTDDTLHRRSTRGGKPLFDQLVYAGEDLWRDRKAQGFCGSQINEQPEDCSLLHWEFGRRSTS